MYSKAMEFAKKNLGENHSLTKNMKEAACNVRNQITKIKNKKIERQARSVTRLGTTRAFS